LSRPAQAAHDGGETVKRLLLFTRAAPERSSWTDGIVRNAQLTAPRWRDAAQAEGGPSGDFSQPGHPSFGLPAQVRVASANVIFNAVVHCPGGAIRHRGG
jgi:hypothetical protein